MLNHFERIFKIVCLILAAVMIYQISRIFLRSDPLTNIHMPDVPTLATNTATNAATNILAVTNQTVKGTNGMNLKGTNRLGVATNNVPRRSQFQAPNNSDLTRPAQARIARITDSEILGPVIRPPPMALLGIAGDTAFFRSPEGETGLLKEGDTLGGVKLLRIGTNRILIQQDGTNKELTIFEGYGGESLLPKEQEISK